MEKAVSCQNITKVFGEGLSRVEALRGVDLDLDEGKLLMIVGPSGSGKTTLISILAGILDPTEGECSILGNDLKSLNSEELTHFRGKNVGFVFQTFNLIPMLTAKENVSIPLVLNGVDEKEALERAAALLVEYGLEHRMEEHPNNLSGGEQQRVAIARSNIHEPRLIVCDEPTSSLDSETGAHVMDLFREEVMEKSRSLIIVTHDVRILKYADRIVRIEDGQIVEGDQTQI